MALWGSKFAQELRLQLEKEYSYAPGINGDAYQRGRKEKFKGQGDKIASSSLYKSISYQTTDDGFVLLMNDYWEWVNYGRQEGKYVPINPLEEWARLKGFDNPRGAAFGISTNIKKFGIAPTNFFENAQDVLGVKFDEALDEQMGRSISQFFDNLFTENIITTE